MKPQVKSEGTELGDTEQVPSRYAQAVYRVLKLPAEEQGSEHGLAHFLGTVTIERNDAAMDAALEIWIRNVRAELRAWRANVPADWHREPQRYVLKPDRLRFDFYLFHEYERAVAELLKEGHGNRTPSIDPSAYERFLAVYDRLRHSPDRTGYTQYRLDLGSTIPAAEIFPFGEYKEACQVVESGRALLARGFTSIAWDTHVRRRFEQIFNARVHTPDRVGYRRYLAAEAAPNVRRFLARRLRVCLPEEDLKLNSYIFASPGAGKSELLKLLVHAHIRKPGAAALVVLDVASDFATQLRFREFAEDDSRLVYIDPYLDYDYTPTINPFRINRTFSHIEIERHVKDRLSAEISSALEQMITDQGGALSPNMEAVLAVSSRALLDLPDATFEHLLQLMLNAEGEELRAECAQRTTSKSAYEFFSSEEAIEQSKPSRDGIANRLRATFLKFDAFRHLTCGRTTVHLERLIEERKIIVFNLAKGDTTKPVALAFGRFILATINALGYRRMRTEPEKRTPTHIIIDEFQNFVTDSVFETIEELRKFRIMQTLVQPTLFGRMSKEQRKAFLNGVQGTRFFGKCDPTIAEYVAELAGGIDPKDVIELSKDNGRKGEFFVRTQGRPTFLLNIDTRLLNNRNSLTDAEWEPLRLRQLDRYYRRKELNPKEEFSATSRTDEPHDTTKPEPTSAQPTSKPSTKARRPPRRPPPP